jgi:single-strand DNA-binding protein
MLSGAGPTATTLPFAGRGLIMANFNRVILMGNLTRDVELRYTQSGLAVTDIGMAVNDRRKNQAGEWVEEATFVDVTLWGRTAEIASEYLNKGSPVFIEGRLKYDTWESEGQKRSKLRVVGERLQLIGGRGGGASRGGPPPDESEYSRPAPASVPQQTPEREPEPPPNDVPF